MTGISERVAQGLLAEIGLNMDQFPSAKHLASWVGICPGNHESAGKRLSGKTCRGNPYARRLLIQAAHAAAHSKNTDLASQYRRIAARRGPKRAAVAVGHSILVIVYYLLRDRGTYQDLGGNYFDQRDHHMLQKQLVRRLERLGYQVELQPLAQAGRIASGGGLFQKRTPHLRPRDLDAPQPLTTLSQALIDAFKESFPLARKRKKEEDPNLTLSLWMRATLN